MNTKTKHCCRAGYLALLAPAAALVLSATTVAQTFRVSVDSNGIQGAEHCRRSACASAFHFPLPLSAAPASAHTCFWLQVWADAAVPSCTPA